MNHFENFEDYQKQAMTTAFESAKNFGYASYGLVAEVGELFGVIAKNTRDNWSAEELSSNIVKESGDVMWFIALIAELTGVTPQLEEPEIEDDTEFSTELTLDSMMRHATTVFYRLAASWEPFHESLLDAVEESLNELYRLVSHTVRYYTGHDAEHAMVKNIEKLASRQKRGVISGSGDNR